MKWNEVIGQDDVKQRLMGLLSGGRVPHAVMLCGETGYGTLALALALASALLCDKTAARVKGSQTDGLFGDGMQASFFGDETDASAASDNGTDSATGAAGDEAATEACGECRQCMMLQTWQHPDLHFSFPVVKLPSMSADHQLTSDDFLPKWYEMLQKTGPYITFEQWLEQMGATTQQAIIPASESDNIAKKLSLTSSQGGYKVIVMWQAERMNDVSANKILKTLEEPTPNTVFILIAERPELLLETIRSRVQRIDVPKLSCQAIEETLVAQRGLERGEAHGLARAADGNWTAAVEQLMPDSETRMFLDMFKMLMRQVYARDVRGMKKWCDTVSTFGREKQKRLLAYFMRMIREAFMSNFHEPELSYMNNEEQAFVKNFGPFINEKNVIEINSLLELAMRDISQNTNQKVVFFDTALRLTALLLRNNKK